MSTLPQTRAAIAVVAVALIALIAGALAANLIRPGISRAGDGGEDLLAPVPGRPTAPAFDLKGPDDRQARLSDYKGRPLVLNFWATWCPPCREEMPSMERAHRELAKDGIGMVAVNAGDDAEAVRAFLARMRVDFPLVLDPDTRVTDSYSVEGLPTTFVIDPEGRLAYVAAGEREWDSPEMLKRIRALKR
jgi:peroxiredoxin